MVEQKKIEKPTKIKRKKWCQIIAPKIFRDIVLGETFIADPKLALNKTITQNLMNLIHDVRKQNINIKFIVDNVEGDNAYTSIIGYGMIPASIRRLTRRRSEKIELSFVCSTSDNKKIRIKPLILAISMTKGSVAAKLNKTVIEYLNKTISKMTFDNLVTDLINYKLQTSLKEHLKKIYPLRTCEIKSMEIEKEKKPLEEKKKVEKEKPIEERKGKEEPKKKETKKSEETEAKKEPSKEEKPKEPKEVKEEKESKEEK